METDPGRNESSTKVWLIEFCEDESSVAAFKFTYFTDIEETNGGNCTELDLISLSGRGMRSCGAKTGVV